MNNFAYQNCTRQNDNSYNLNTYFPQMPNQAPSTLPIVNDERFGGAFLVPFWYLGAQNKANQMYQQQMYYQYNNPYPYYQS